MLTWPFSAFLANYSKFLITAMYEVYDETIKTPTPTTRGYYSLFCFQSAPRDCGTVVIKAGLGSELGTNSEMIL